MSPTVPLPARPVALAAEAAGAGGGIGLQIGLVLLLVVVNAAFAGSEIALVSLSESRLERLRERSRSGAVLARLARDPGRFLSTIQIGITLAGFLAAAAGATALAQPLIEPLTFLGRAAEPAAVVLVTIAISFVTLVFGELAPKRLALQRAEGWGLLAARPLAALATLTRPVVTLLTKSTDLTVRLLGGDPAVAREEVSEEELRDMVAAQRLDPGQQSIIDGAFEVSERTLHEILVPRSRVFVVGGDVPAEQAVHALVRAGHSRAPVVRGDRNGGDLDRVFGVVHLRDLVEVTAAVRHAVRPALVLPETVGVLDALGRLRDEREHLAVVINEHGGTEGIVTLEDLLEEIVGEIYDEYDRDLDPDDPEGVERAADGTLVLPGTFPVHDLPDVGVHVPQGEYATVAGLMLALLGRLPEVGETVDADGARFEVLARDKTAIARVRIVPDTPSGPPDAAAGDQ